MRIHLEMLDYNFFSSLCHFLSLSLSLSFRSMNSYLFRLKSEHTENNSVRHHFHSHCVSVGMLPNDKKNIVLIKKKKKTHTHIQCYWSVTKTSNVPLFWNVTKPDYENGIDRCLNCYSYWNNHITSHTNTHTHRFCCQINKKNDKNSIISMNYWNHSQFFSKVFIDFKYF